MKNLFILSFASIGMLTDNMYIAVTAVIVVILYAIKMNIFKHDCSMNKKMLSASYFKDGDSGVIFQTGKEYCCSKCGKKWNE